MSIDSKTRGRAALSPADRRADQSLVSAPLPAKTLSPMVITFLVGLMIPIQLYVGDLRLSVYRIVLLLVFIPASLRLLSGDISTRLRLPDVLIGLFALSGAVSLLATRASIPTVGIFVVEALGPYLLARAFVRSAAQLATVARVLTVCIIATLPFAVYESYTRDPILLTLLGRVFDVIPNVPHEMRLGLDRAQLTFEHPILYGVFCAMVVSMAFYITRVSDAGLSPLRGFLVSLGAFFSLSSGAFVPVALQFALIAYDRIMGFLRSRWKLLVLSVGTVAIAAELGSNRTLSEIAIDYVAMNPHNAWSRLIINEWAWEAVMNRPFFGYGFTHAMPPRPEWLQTGAIDNLWLAMAARHGLPTPTLLGAAALSVCLVISRGTIDDPRVQASRTSLVITIVGICISVFTVHLWNATFCAFIFLLGCGLWVPDWEPAPSNAAAPQAATDSPPPAMDRGAGPDRLTGPHRGGLLAPTPRAGVLNFGRTHAQLSGSEPGAPYDFTRFNTRDDGPLSKDTKQ